MAPASRRFLVLGLVAWPLIAAQHRETFTYSFDLNPGETRYFDVMAREKGVRLKVQFEVVSPRNSSGVRVGILSEEAFLHIRESQIHREIQSSRYRLQGSLRARLEEPGRYMVVIENRMERRRSRVEMLMVLTSGPEPEKLPVSYASPRKRLVVVSVSLAGFLLILVLSGKALWRATRG